VSNIQPDNVADVEDVRGEEPNSLQMMPVPVVVDGPVVAQLAGSRVGIARSVAVTTSPQQVLGSDPRRRRVVLLADATVRVGTYEDVDNDAGFLLYALVPLELTHIDAVWARTDSGTGRLSVLVENWTE
jgi:methenyltetrahydromethanopterin cyclohydrolase